MVRNFFINLCSDDSGPYQSYPLPGNRFLQLNSENICSLEEPFTSQEIRKALFDIGPLKAPGPDGFHALFYQHFWSTVGDSLTQLALCVLEGCDFPEGFNDIPSFNPKTG